jgi:diguanylate cyclase (GGDEF)-like protein/PAS domain S-box-containing protein
MNTQYTSYNNVLIAILSIFIISTLFIYFQKPFKKRVWSIPIFIMLFGCIIWIGGNYLELIFIDTNVKIFFYSLQNLGLMLIPVSWFIFSLLYSGYQKWVKLRNIIILAIIPFTTTILIFTNKFHNLIVTNYEVLNYKSFIVIDKSFGIWQTWVDLPYNMLLGIFAAFFILRSVLKKATIYKWQAIAFTITAIIPLFTGTLNIVNINPFPYLELTPILLGSSLIIIVILLSRTRIGEIIPLARDNVIENIGDGFLILDHNDILIDINNKAEKILGKSEKELIGKDFYSLLPELTNKKNNFNIVDEIDITENKIRATFEIITTEIHNFYRKVVGKSIILHDITERKKSEDNIKYLSFHDLLTELYNRRFFEEELKRLDCERQLPISIIMGDLNGLKLVNDVFGHTEGDALLKLTTDILKRVCRSEDILARWGGDEFVLLLPKTSIADSEDIMIRIIKECKKTSGQKIPVSLSLGDATKETTVQNIQAIAIDAENNMYKNKLAQKESISSSIIFALDQALYEKSSETKEHTDRICDFAIRLGKSINLSSSQLDELSLLALLHDIGKVAIPETILLKEGRLTEKEWEVIKKHPEIGFNIANASPQIAHIAKAILSCHESWDGCGYPQGLAGESIPIISRIVNIADAYDVMMSKRSYKEPMSKDNAMEELKKCAGSQFDPELINKFISIITDEEKTCYINKEKVLIKQK